MKIVREVAHLGGYDDLLGHLADERSFEAGLVSAEVAGAAKAAPGAAKAAPRAAKAASSAKAAKATAAPVGGSFTWREPRHQEVAIAICAGLLWYHLRIHHDYKQEYNRMWYRVRESVDACLHAPFTTLFACSTRATRAQLWLREMPLQCAVAICLRGRLEIRASSADDGSEVAKAASSSEVAKAASSANAATPIVAGQAAVFLRLR